MTRLRDHLRAPIDEARLERQWGAVRSAGLPSAAPRGRWRLALAWALVGMAAIGGLLLQLRGVERTFERAGDVEAAALPTGAVLESEDREIAVQLSDGSRVALAPRAQIRVRANQPTAIELELQSGAARFDVRHDSSRRFAIRIGAAEVRVLGTRFSLERRERTDGTFVEVRVQEGVVEVERNEGQAGQTRELSRLHPGESWSALFAHSEPVSEPPLDSEDALDLNGAEPEPEQQELPRTTRAPASRLGTPGETASELFRQGTLARRAGRMREAAESYRLLLERFPRDARSGLSAFELGRLRMDALGDAPGAIEALERALLATGSSASFREDALARIVVAADALGRTQQCLRARQRYAEQYPGGVHESALAQRCK